MRAENHGCAKCKPGPSEELDLVDTKETGGKSWSVEKIYQCRSRSAQWNHIRKGGLGGPGDFWHPDPVINRPSRQFALEG